MRADKALYSADPGIRFWTAHLAVGRLDGMPLACCDGQVLGRGRSGPLSGRASASFGGGFVLLYDAGRDAPAGVNCDALVFRPCPDVAAALPA
jgi:hypothetical protein